MFREGMGAGRSAWAAVFDEPTGVLQRSHRVAASGLLVLALGVGPSVAEYAVHRLEADKSVVLAVAGADDSELALAFVAAMTPTDGYLVFELPPAWMADGLTADTGLRVDGRGRLVVVDPESGVVAWELEADGRGEAVARIVAQHLAGPALHETNPRARPAPLLRLRRPRAGQGAPARPPRMLRYEEWPEPFRSAPFRIVTRTRHPGKPGEIEAWERGGLQALARHARTRTAKSFGATVPDALDVVLTPRHSSEDGLAAKLVTLNQLLEAHRDGPFVPMEDVRRLTLASRDMGPWGSPERRRALHAAPLYYDAEAVEGEAGPHAARMNDFGTMWPGDGLPDPGFEPPGPTPNPPRFETGAYGSELSISSVELDGRAVAGDPSDLFLDPGQRFELRLVVELDRRGPPTSMVPVVGVVSWDRTQLACLEEWPAPGVKYMTWRLESVAPRQPGTHYVGLLMNASMSCEVVAGLTAELGSGGPPGGPLRDGHDVWDLPDAEWERLVAERWLRTRPRFSDTARAQKGAGLRVHVRER